MASWFDVGGFKLIKYILNSAAGALCHFNSDDKKEKGKVIYFPTYANALFFFENALRFNAVDDNPDVMIVEVDISEEEFARGVDGTTLNYAGTDGCIKRRTKNV